MDREEREVPERLLSKYGMMAEFKNRSPPFFTVSAGQLKHEATHCTSYYMCLIINECTLCHNRLPVSSSC
jgi:hypothetical protein